MTPAKRIFDLVVALVALPLMLVAMAAVAALILIRDGRPVVYGSERMRDPRTSFTLWKFRTMVPRAGDAGVTGGDKNARLTQSGRFLRRFRLDELPQIFNVLCGDMSLVGPRPPLRRYVDLFPDIYAEVLRCRPGLAGLATLHCRRREERLLSACRTPAETEAVYQRRCVRQKARVDLIYLRHRSLCFDLVILGQTMFRLVSG